ncbi:hypothetical protein [Nocardioides stalactiti]|uniref:hypothetical protein n=1 Tax=Nocardioides stalactiti TaxID=2755356 RepID=UPI0015FF9FD6|nr:hypothetical protein [Nocardioides stalactiti]
MSGQKRFNLLNLIDACEEAFESRHADDVESEGRIARCGAIAREFGLLVLPDVPKTRIPMVQLVLPGPRRDDDLLGYLLGDCLRARRGWHSPFEGMSEGTESIIAMYQRFGARLNEALAEKDQKEFRLVLDEMLVAIVAQIWRLDERATVEVDFLGPRAEAPADFY